MPAYDPLQALMSWRYDLLKEGMMRYRICTITAVLVLYAHEADACAILAPPVEEVAADVAVDGALISGELIQAYDASKQQSPIIRAHAVFVGSAGSRDFVIYVPHMPEGVLRTSCDRAPPSKAGQIYERLVLEPAPSKVDAAANGRWSIHRFGGSVTSGKGLELLLAKAAEAGRLNAPPPHDPRYDGE